MNALWRSFNSYEKTTFISTLRSVNLVSLKSTFLAGVIPGPEEPPLTLKQHLTSLVDEFLVFWDPGVRLLHMCKFPEGRLILCALILVICNLLATRKTIGYAACAHEHFCSICKCTCTGEGYGNTDCRAWARRSNEEWCKAAIVRFPLQ